MPVAADDDVVMHRDAERLRCLDNHARHLDVVARRLGIARGVIVQLALGCSRRLKSPRKH
jgi:hypothetical protein